MTDRQHLIRTARARKGITGHAVAYMVNTPASNIYAMESGANGVGDGMIRRYLDAGLITREEAIAALIGPATEEAV